MDSVKVGDAFQPGGWVNGKSLYLRIVFTYPPPTTALSLAPCLGGWCFQYLADSSTSFAKAGYGISLKVVPDDDCCGILRTDRCGNLSTLSLSTEIGVLKAPIFAIFPLRVIKKPRTARGHRK